MPRKTAAWRLPSDRQRSFNEAAARCRGKHGLRNMNTILMRQASMRPRPDAAENRRPSFQSADLALLQCAAARCRGKRRAITAVGDSSPCFNEAAARCRGKHAPPPAAQSDPALSLQ